MASVLKSMESAQRPYERCLACGPAVLTDSELLAVLLRTGTKEMDVMELASVVLRQGKYPGAAGLLHLSYEDLTAVRGIGKVKAVQLLCMGELAKRIWRSEGQEAHPVIDTPEKCAAWFQQELKHLEQEELRIVFLDLRSRMTGDMVLTRGTSDQSLVSVRDILVETLRHRASSIILMHNHPGGTPDPSEDDILVTDNVKKGCEAAGIRLSDHIIIAGNTYFSFQERGLL